LWDACSHLRDAGFAFILNIQLQTALINKIKIQA
jgi:hypothetical protein